MSSYETMSDHELLTISRDNLDHPKAIKELLFRQRHGRAMRLYPYGRSGANDEGVIPFAMEVQTMMVAIDMGTAGRSVIIPKQQVGLWAAGAAERIIIALTQMFNSGLNDSTAVRRMQEQATPNFSINCIAVFQGTDKEGIEISLQPDDVTHWVLGISECRLFSASLLSEADDQGWTDEDIQLPMSQLAFIDAILDSEL